MTKPERKPPFRLAFRKEGEFVHVYLAAIDTMQDASLLATMRVTVLEATPGLFDEFRALIQKTIEYGMQGVVELDTVRGWVNMPAPPSERTGDA